MLLLLLLQPVAADYTVQLPEGEVAATSLPPQVAGHGLTSAGGRPFAAWEGIPYADPPDRWQPPRPRSGNMHARLMLAQIHSILK